MRRVPRVFSILFDSLGGGLEESSTFAAPSWILTVDMMDACGCQQRKNIIGWCFAKQKSAAAGANWPLKVARSCSLSLSFCISPSIPPIHLSGCPPGIPGEYGARLSVFSQYFDDCHTVQCMSFGTRSRPLSSRPPASTFSSLGSSKHRSRSGL